MLQPEKVSPLHNIIHSADYLFWSFDISKGILRDQKLMIGLPVDSFTKRILNVWPQYNEFKSGPFEICKITAFFTGCFCKIYRVTNEAIMTQTTV